jgi:uncharacterized cupredoxin-like copper-binding protein
VVVVGAVVVAVVAVVVVDGAVAAGTRPLVGVAVGNPGEQAAVSRTSRAAARDHFAMRASLVVETERSLGGG